MNFRSRYAQKLTDPRWQKKRLQMFDAAGWKCQNCGAADRELHVHHLVYSKGNPWDAPADTLEVLCSECHDWRTGFDKEWGRSLISTSIASGLILFIRLAVRSKNHWTGYRYNFTNPQHFLFEIDFRAEGEKSQGRESASPVNASTPVAAVVQSPPVIDAALTGEAADNPAAQVTVIPAAAGGAVTATQSADDTASRPNR